MPINVHVKARPQNAPIEWDVDFKSPPDPGKVRIDLPRGSGPQDIVFHLVPTHGLDAQFDPNDPIWVSRGDSCPGQSGLDPQITVVGSTSANKLTIHNANSGPGCTLHYQLNFLGAEPCDPIIINGGGGLDGPGD